MAGVHAICGTLSQRMLDPTKLAYSPGQPNDRLC